MRSARAVAVWFALLLTWLVPLAVADFAFSPLHFEPYGTLWVLTIASRVAQGVLLFLAAVILVVASSRVLLRPRHALLAVCVGLALWLINGLGVLAAFRSGGEFTLGPFNWIYWTAPPTTSISPALPSIFFGTAYVLPAVLAVLGGLLGAWLASRSRRGASV